ncbi:MAG: PQQ-binding-like beta-propeller repeat protein, partial [Planctomycetes bacterium]|nr:PQQ-binding-like beta-propeller repeat protein [Planctomycetota bacterium]
MIHRTVAIQLAIATAIPCAAGWCAGRAHGADNAPPPIATAYADTYVDDSFEVRELLSELATHARRGRWVEASQLVQRIYDLHADRLVQVDAGLYEGVVETLNHVVAQWPKDGLAAYRALFDQAAQDRFEAARRGRDIDALLAILDRYFCTSVGVSIAEATCDLALESADFALAEDACKRVLESHPDRASVADRFAGRLALIAALTGDVVKAERWASVHRGGAEEAMIHWMGRAEPLVPLLKTIASDPVATEHSEGEFFWPVFGGDTRRNREGTFQFEPIVQLWRFDEFPPGSLGPQADPSESASLRRAIEAGKFLVFNPVAGLGLIFFQDADDVWALQASSGTLVWHFRGGGDDASRFASGDGSLPEWHSPTLDADRLYVCLGGESVPYYGYEARANVSALLCLDARTGQLQWRADRLRFGDSLAKMRFDASPLVRHGRVYVVGRRRRTFGFEDCYLLQFRASDGALLHQTHLGSASTGGFGYRRATRSIPALADNTVYVNTQLGTIAAVSARTGRVRWLRLYEREPEAEWRQSIRSSSREIVPWHYNPTICSSKWVVCRPSDAPRVLVIDRQDGRIVHDVHTADLKDMETLLAVRDGTLYGIGEDVFAFDLDSARMIWSQPLPDDAGLYGRGTVASGRIIIPTNTYLCAYDLHDGARSQIPWASGEQGGNLLGIADQLVVAGYDHIALYGRKKDVWDRLHRLMTQSPNDPEPALDLAELAFRSGDLDQAAEVFDQAIQRAGGFVGLTDEAIRSRIFQDCLRFAKAWPKDREALRERVERFYEYAAQCAPDTTAHVVYRFQFAEYLSRQSQPERAVSVYQQILADRSLRDAVGVGELPGGETAGLAAQKRIHELIAEHGRGVYAPFDAEATS